MKLTKHDLEDTKIIAGIIQKIDAMDEAYATSIADDIYKKQPFFLSSLLGYHFDVTPIELEEIMKAYFIIWEFFKDNKNVQNQKITQKLFEKICDRNISMLHYANGETAEQQPAIFHSDLQNLKSKSLMSVILFRFKDHPNLADMSIQVKAQILIGIKSFIECFEIISAGPK